MAGTLLIKPPPYQDESLASFLLRFAGANGWDADWILESLHIEDPWNPQKINQGLTAEQLSRLKELTGVSSIDGMTIHRFAKALIVTGGNGPAGRQALGEEEIERYVHQTGTKFCPVCIEEAQYHRIHWDILPLTSCLKHSLLLVDKCSRCNEPIRHEEVILGEHECRQSGHEGRQRLRSTPSTTCETGPSRDALSFVAGLLGIQPSGGLPFSRASLFRAFCTCIFSAY